MIVFATPTFTRPHNSNLAMSSLREPSSLQDVLRLFLLLFAVYTSVYGIWAILLPSKAWGGNLPLDTKMDDTTVRTIGMVTFTYQSTNPIRSTSNRSKQQVGNKQPSVSTNFSPLGGEIAVLSLPLPS
jgi:hypothetical protein